MSPPTLGEGPLRLMALIGVVFVTATLGRLMIHDGQQVQPPARAAHVAAAPAGPRVAVPGLARVAMPAKLATSGSSR